jgi:hypothetical protein
MLGMRRRTLTLVFALVVVGCGSTDAQLATPGPPKTLQQLQAPAKADDQVQMKATLIKLQVQVLERDREIGTLRAQVAELQLNALGTAIQTLDPAVKKALGLEQSKPVEKPVQKE